MEEPDKALKVIDQLVAACSGGKTSCVDLRQDECELIDHGAESVATAVALDAKRRGIGFRGKFPKDLEQQAVVLATGLPRYLKISLPQPEGFLTFPLRSGRGGADRATASSAKEFVATELVEHLDTCLGQYNWELAEATAMHLADLAGEILANAEDHSQRPEWWVSAYLRHHAADRYGDYHISIFNFGRSLGESLRDDLPVDSDLRADINRLVQQHRKRRLFASGWGEDDLWTLYALQGGVSRLGGDRGNGTVEMIEFFQRIGQSRGRTSSPKMCLVSGRTQIIFDGRYQMRLQRTRRGGKAHILAFNTGNDLEQPPDTACVRSLGRRFPGTLISLRVFLDPEHLNRLGGS